MTTEILMLNKDGVVVAADSAVTTGQKPHPRYSKTANKIFDLVHTGTVALTIFASAEIDRVPWQLAVKEFRKFNASNEQLEKLEDYPESLISFLEENKLLFPDEVIEGTLSAALLSAAVVVLNRAKFLNPQVVDVQLAMQERQNAWSSVSSQINASLNGAAFHPLLDGSELNDFTDCVAQFQAALVENVEGTLEYQSIDPTEWFELSKDVLLKQPTDVLSYTGLVFAGYGSSEIFPSYRHINVYGHVGKKLVWEHVSKYKIDHTNNAWIQPFAQSSMIDRFTDGFDASLRQIISDESQVMLNSVMTELRARGVEVSDDHQAQVTTSVHAGFMKEWVQKNWNKNFHPLTRVLNGLSIQEMGHLAESLLVLEELRERVTSPSESVGGPIDVVVVTKSEGLIWLKRKHYFNSDTNLRYLNRVKMEYN